MYRVLLVIDDYNELVYLQTLMKKLGFDVEGIQNPKKFETMQLGFNPQLIIASAQGRNVDGLKLAQGIHKNKLGLPALIILQSVGQSIEDKIAQLPQVDEVLDSPVNIHRLINVLAKYSDQKESTLLDKYAKMKGTGETPDAENGSNRSSETIDTDDEIQHIRGQRIQETTISKSKRRERFSDYLAKMEKPAEKSHFPRERIIAYNKAIRAEKPEDDEDLEEARRSFVKALFKK